MIIRKKTEPRLLAVGWLHHTMCKAISTTSRSESGSINISRHSSSFCTSTRHVTLLTLQLFRRKRCRLTMPTRTEPSLTGSHISYHQQYLIGACLRTKSRTFAPSEIIVPDPLRKREITIADTCPLTLTRGRCPRW